MKRALLLFYLIASIANAKAQTLYSVTPNGGTDGVGSLIKFNTTTNNFTVVRSYENYAKYPNYTHLIEASNGKMYGMTLYGGNDRIAGPGYGGGVIFSFDPSTAAYTKLKNFDGTDGVGPSGSLMQASDGKLYGMTTGGGINFVGNVTNGVIFSYDPSTSTYKKLKEFDYTNGAWPYGSLIQGKDGKLYGMTSGGGRSNHGVIFSLDPTTLTYTKLKDFDGSNGGDPLGSLVQTDDGKMYGLTKQGGASDHGVIFSFDPTTAVYTVLKEFDGASGANPAGSMIVGTNGKLYGMAPLGGSNGAGVIFSFDPSTSTYTKLKNLDNANGNAPSGDLVQAANGMLYGTTNWGGENIINGGVLFSFDPSTSTYTKLQEFIGANGYNPNGGLLLARNGKLYGMTSGGGNSLLGIIYSFDPSSATYTKLKDFEAPSGRNPTCRLVQANNGKLYGMTPVGGKFDVGVLFSFDPANDTYEKLKDFSNPDGAYPNGSLVLAGNGKLYGMTSGGGTYLSGVIFSFDPSTSVYTKIVDFDNDNGGHPTGSLVQATNGKLYGMTTSGGSEGNGVIFSFDPASSTYTRLKDFILAEGAQCYGSLMQASNGKLYGMTHYGGSNGAGVIFSFDLSTSTYTKLKELDGSSNYGPYGSLTQANNGKIYGMTYSGGNSNGGILFSFDPSSSIYTRIMDFDYAKGTKPSGDLMQASDGKLYGMTDHGGSNDGGVMFSFDPATSTYTKLHDLDGNYGGNPSLSSSFVEINGTVLATVLNFNGKNDGSINQLSWKVENGQDVNYFELQRGVDGKNFSALTQIKATGSSSYSYSDHVVASTSPVYFYRLKIVDKEGNFKYSENIKLNVVPQISITPNLFSNSNTVLFTLPEPQKVSVRVYDVTGRLVKTLVSGQLQAGMHQYTWYGNDEAGNMVSNGVYFLNVIMRNYSQTRKIVAVRR